MKRNISLSPILLIILLMSSIVMGCAKQTTTSNPDNYAVPTFVQTSVKTWQMIDLSAHTAFTVAGDLYAQKYITKAQKDKIVKLGNTLYASLDITRTSIQNYVWADAANLSTSDTEQIIRNNFKAMVTNYTQIKVQLESLISNVSSYSVSLPSITLPDNLK